MSDVIYLRVFLLDSLALNTDNRIELGYLILRNLQLYFELLIFLLKRF